MSKGHHGPNRDYKAEYKDYHGKAEARKNRSEVTMARQKMEKMNGKMPHMMEVDHIKPVSKGGTNATKNLRVVPRAVNRSKGNRSA